MPEVHPMVTQHDKSKMAALQPPWGEDGASVGKELELAAWWREAGPGLQLHFVPSNCQGVGDRSCCATWDDQMFR